MIDETRYRETTVATESRPRVSMETSAVTGPEPLEYAAGPMKTTAWGPIWAGVLVTIGVQVILSVLGTAIGLSVVQSQPDADTAKGVGIGAGIWWVCSMIVSLFLGGWTVAWLAAPRRAFSGALHGFIMWCTLMALSAALFSLVSGAAIGGGLGMLSGTIYNNNNSNPNSSFKSTPSSNQSRNDDYSSSSRMNSSNDRFNRDEVRTNPPPRDEFSSSSSSSSNYSNNPSSNNDNDRDTFTNRDAQAKAQQVAKTSAAVSWWTWVALVLSAGAAVIGGSMSPARIDEYSRRDEYGTRHVT